MGHGGRQPNAGELSMKIVTAIADHVGVDPLALHPPLYEVIDLEALEALFRSPTGGKNPAIDRVVFSYDGIYVGISNGADVEVSDSPIE